MRNWTEEEIVINNWKVKEIKEGVEDEHVPKLYPN